MGKICRYIHTRTQFVQWKPEMHVRVQFIKAHNLCSSTWCCVHFVRFKCKWWLLLWFYHCCCAYDYYLTLNYTGSVFTVPYTPNDVFTFNVSDLVCGCARARMRMSCDKWWCDPVKIQDAYFKILYFSPYVFPISCHSLALCAFVVKLFSFTFKPISLLWASQFSNFAFWMAATTITTQQQNGEFVHLHSRNLLVIVHLRIKIIAKTNVEKVP